MARFIRLAEAPTIAEPAITIADDFQNRGLGHLLACVLARAARDRGIRRFRGPILTDNLQVHRLLGSFGVQLQAGDECQQFDIDLERPQWLQALAQTIVTAAEQNTAR